MAKEKSVENKRKKLEQQLLRFKDNPEKARRLQGKLAALKGKK
jgi:hypothetical protein